VHSYLRNVYASQGDPKERQSGSPPSLSRGRREGFDSCVVSAGFEIISTKAVSTVIIERQSTGAVGGAGLRLCKVVFRQESQQARHDRPSPRLRGREEASLGKGKTAR